MDLPSANMKLNAGGDELEVLVDKLLRPSPSALSSKRLDCGCWEDEAVRILVTFQTNVHYFFVYSVVPPLIFLVAFLGRLSASQLEAIPQVCPGWGFLLRSNQRPSLDRTLRTVLHVYP